MHDSDFYYNDNRKEKRLNRRLNTKKALNQRKFIYQQCSYKHRSTMPRGLKPYGEYDEDFEFTLERVGFAHRSGFATAVKHRSAHRIRKMGYDMLPSKGNYYKKIGDQWAWNWF